MCNKIKRSFASVLRSNNIKYTTSKDALFIKTISISFFDELDNVTIRDARFSNLWYNTPYATPATLLKKLVFFKSIVRKWQNANSFRFSNE